MVEVNLFVGPSSFGLDAKLLSSPGLRLHPPAGRGDIDALLRASQSPAVIVICDGVFECQPAVSHKEICAALDQGWQVWGVSSIGAIRAREMAQQGMRGFGQIYEMFCQPDDFCDDEVCLLHFPEAPFFPVSEPLVNVRFALSRMATQFGISSADGEQLIAYLRTLWFGERTMEAIGNFMRTRLGLDEAIITQLATWIAANRIKAIDLKNLLAARPWENE